MNICQRMVCLAMTAASAAVAAPPTIGGCPMFPADNYWNTRIDSLAVHSSSATWVASVGNAVRLHPDWSNNLADGYGSTPALVGAGQPLVPIAYAPTADVSQSDPGPFPVPASLRTGSGDRDVEVLDTSTCTLYEMWAAPDPAGPGWIAGTSAKWDMRSNALRPAGHQSADQAGLPVLPGLMRWEEVAAGEIAHAIRFTANNAWGQIDALSAPGSKYLWPARHGSGSSTNPDYPPMGARFRLKASFNVSGYDPRTQIVLRAFQRYGLVFASRGGNWFLQGVSNESWPQVVIDELRSISGSNFEVVDTTPMIVNVDSGQAAQGVSPPPPPPPSGNDSFPPGGIPSGWIQPSGSSAGWLVANDAAYAGSLSLKSGVIGHGQRSEVAYSALFAAGTVSFARRVSSQASADFLQFYIDGVLKGGWSGEQDWAVASYAVPAGTHTFSWRYVKDASASAGADAAWIDSVLLPARGTCRMRTATGRCITE